MDFLLGIFSFKINLPFFKFFKKSRKNITKMNSSVEFEIKISDWLKKIITPLLLAIGLIGNLLSIIVFSRTSLKHKRNSRYLSILAGLDTLVLYSSCVPIVMDAYFDIDLRILNQFSCRFFSFLIYYFSHMASIFLSIINYDNARALTRKLQANEYLTPFKKLIITALIILIFDFHFLIFSRLIRVDLKTGKEININHDRFNKTLKSILICFCYENSIYFKYLTQYFPW